MIDFNNLYGSSVIDMKLKKIKYLLYATNGMSFDYFFDPTDLTYKIQVLFDDCCYHGAITEAFVRNEPVHIIVNSILDTIRDTQVMAYNQIDPEWVAENENEQAFLDAGMDYGVI